MNYGVLNEELFTAQRIGDYINQNKLHLNIEKGLTDVFVHANKLK